MKAAEVEKLILQFKNSYGQLPDWAEAVSETMPELLDAWLKIRSIGIPGGVIPRKYRELILLGINLVRRYPSGIENHLRGAMDAGATKEEVMEVIATAIISSAAPSMYNGPRALRAELERRKKIKPSAV